MGVWIGWRQIGHREEVEGAGGVTVKMGRFERAENGVWDFVRGARGGGEVGRGGRGVEVEGGDAFAGLDAREERATVLVGGDGCGAEALFLVSDERERWDWTTLGSPEITGGGRSRPSAAFLESCRAKSEACHHSKNLRAKRDVGRRTLRLERSRGKMILANTVGLNMLDVCPGLAPRWVVEEPSVAKAIAR